MKKETKTESGLKAAFFWRGVIIGTVLAALLIFALGFAGVLELGGNKVRNGEYVFLSDCVIDLGGEKYYVRNSGKTGAERRENLRKEDLHKITNFILLPDSSVILELEEGVFIECDGFTVDVWEDYDGKKK